MLLWQAGEVSRMLSAAGEAQKTLFQDLAAWASSENRALSDVSACVAELTSLYAGTQVQLASAYKAFRKDISLILEGETRCDAAQKKLQEAEHKRLKLRRQVRGCDLYRENLSYLYWPTLVCLSLCTEFQN